MNRYWIYFMASTNNRTLYVGVTNDLKRRVAEHKQKVSERSFTSRYNCVKLVCFEEYTDIRNAIAREKNIKNWKRAWKDTLINAQNPDWRDLAAEWY